MRELRNALKRAAVLASDTLALSDLPSELRGRSAPPPTLEGGGTLKDVIRHLVAGAERDLIVRTLERTQWNRAQTARLLGINYKTLQSKLKEYRLSRADRDASEP